jgi:thiol-disulfide isomerase/thioredoxin
MAMLLPILCGAQSPPVKALSIGDTVPDITLTNVYNYPDSVIRLSDLKGKLVILDFWSITCLSCIAFLPKIDSLQIEFENEVQFILVNNEVGNKSLQYEEKARSFVNSWDFRYGYRINLPVSFNRNKSLRKMFPFIVVPHYVWIGPENELLAITSTSELTTATISSALKGETKNISQKIDTLLF